MYVALSRPGAIRLLCDFDDSLFTTHPSNELREKDGRLERVNAETLANYEAAQRACTIAGTCKKSDRTEMSMNTAKIIIIITLCQEQAGHVL